MNNKIFHHSKILIIVINMVCVYIYLNEATVRVYILKCFNEWCIQLANGNTNHRNWHCKENVKYLCIISSEASVSRNCTEPDGPVMHFPKKTKKKFTKNDQISGEKFHFIPWVMYIVQLSTISSMIWISFIPILVCLQ